MSTPALIAVAIASFKVESVCAILCKLIRSSQSETVKPVKPHLSFRISVRRYLFACPGIPFTSPLLIITVNAPASIASLKVGRWSSSKDLFGIRAGVLSLPLEGTL